MFEHPGLARIHARKVRAVAVADILREQAMLEIYLLEEKTHAWDLGISYGAGIAKFLYRNRFAFIGGLGVLIASRFRGGFGVGKVLKIGTLTSLFSWGRSAFQTWQNFKRIKGAVSLLRR